MFRFCRNLQLAFIREQIPFSLEFMSSLQSSISNVCPISDATPCQHTFNYSALNQFTPTSEPPHSIHSIFRMWGRGVHSFSNAINLAFIKKINLDILHCNSPLSTLYTFPPHKKKRKNKIKKGGKMNMYDEQEEKKEWKWIK